MKSNGFGSWQQKIVVSVATKHREFVFHQLGGPLELESDDRSLSSFEWTRHGKSLGNDQDIVWELSMLIGKLDSKDWHIQWDASDY